MTYSALRSPTAIALALLFLALPASAWAAGTREMVALARDLQGFTVPATGAQEAVDAAVEQLHQLKARSELYIEARPDEPFWGWLLLAEGEFGFARGLGRAVCSADLTRSRCRALREALAQKALSWFEHADEAAREAERAPKADLPRVRALRAAIARDRAAAATLAPPTRDVNGPWVVVRRDTEFVTADGQRARVPTGDGSDRSSIRMRLLSLAAGVARVEVPGPSQAGEDVWHCVGQGPLADQYMVAFEVPIEALLSVSVVPRGWTFEDGTSLDLAAGVPLDAQRRPLLREFTAPLSLPPEEVALQWSGPGRHAPYQTVIDWLPQGTPLTLGGQPVVVGASEYLGVTHREERGDRSLLTMSSPCGTVVVAAPRWTPEPPGTGVGGLLGGLGARIPTSRAPSGTPLFWPDGTAAGHSGRDVAWWTSKIEAVGDLRCTSVQLGNLWHEGGPPAGGSVRLCMEASELSAHGPPALPDLLPPDAK